MEPVILNRWPCQDWEAAQVPKGGVKSDNHLAKMLIDRQTDRQIDRQIDRKKDSQIEKQKDMYIYNYIIKSKSGKFGFAMSM